jgi:DNA repair protein RecN (Recombination protein N)
MRASLEELGIELEDADGEVELIVKRELSATGRGRVLLNGSPLSVRELGAAMDAILEIHGQSESRERIAGQNFREVLDDYGDHAALLAETRSTYAAWKESAASLAELTTAQRDRALRLDLLKYQIDEISAARLDPGETESLRGEKAILANAQEMIAATAGAFTAVDEDESSAITQVGRALHLLQPLSDDITDIRQVCGELQDVAYRLQEVGRTLSNLGDSVRHDPQRLEEVEERLVTVERLSKKYGGSVEAVLEHLATISDEFERLNDYESSIEKLQRVEESKLLAYRKAAEKLSTARRNAAHDLQSAIQNELNDLAMERTTVRITLAHAPESGSRFRLGDQEIAFGPDGVDRVDILIAPNRGEEPKSMQKIASGGELSRIQLAIAAALFKHSGRTAAATLVFDEIDAGIGGRVAEVVGRKLQELAAANQVICVTHLPQIAAFGTTHFYVWKEDAKEHTTARIRRLDSRETRVQEIARMLGGETVSQSALTHAAELLEAAHGRGNAKKRPASAVPSTR